MKISSHTGVPFEQMLGVGDLIMDWEFIQLCKYAGAMGNATDDLKERVKTKGKGNYVIGGNVNENGLLDIFRYFSLVTHFLHLPLTAELCYTFLYNL